MLTCSHLVSVAPGPHLLSDIIQQSPILFDPEHAGASGGGEMGGIDDFETSDPELAMALRMSLQEAQEREARERGTASASTNVVASGAAAATASETNTAVENAVVAKDVTTPINPEAGHQAGFSDSETAPLLNANDPSLTAPGDDDEYMDEDEEAMLARAMALSRGENPDDHDILMAEGDEEDEEDEEAAIARAIAMSLEDHKKDDKEKK